MALSSSLSSWGDWWYSMTSVLLEISLECSEIPPRSVGLGGGRCSRMGRASPGPERKINLGRWVRIARQRWWERKSLHGLTSWYSLLHIFTSPILIVSFLIVIMSNNFFVLLTVLTQCQLPYWLLLSDIVNVGDYFHHWLSGTFSSSS